jgi:hypothetical protein
VDGVAGDAGRRCEFALPLVSTTSAFDGTFTLTDVPSGADVPLVIQVGRWRRLVTVSNVPACATTALPAELTRLPTRQGEGSAMDAIPLMALTTGNADPLECMIRNLGVEDSQFSNAGGSGRIRFHVDNGSICTDGGGSCTGTTPSRTSSRRRGGCGTFRAWRYGDDYYAKSPADDPQGPVEGEVRVRRGGGWNSFPLWARSSFRNWNTPSSRCMNLGFRVAMNR